MGFRAHIQSKHEIEYIHRAYFNWCYALAYEWFDANNISISGEKCTPGDAEWEVRKEELKSIPDSAYSDEYALRIGKELGLSPEETGEYLRSFVKDLLDAPTGDYAYVSWY